MVPPPWSQSWAHHQTLGWYQGSREMGTFIKRSSASGLMRPELIIYGIKIPQRTKSWTGFHRLIPKLKQKLLNGLVSPLTLNVHSHSQDIEHSKLCGMAKEWSLDINAGCFLNPGLRKCYCTTVLWEIEKSQHFDGAEVFYAKLISDRFALWSNALLVKSHVIWLGQYNYWVKL